MNALLAFLTFFLPEITNAFSPNSKLSFPLSQSASLTTSSKTTSSRTTTPSTTRLHQTPSFPSFEELQQQKSEALKSLSSFHDGKWINSSGALSFSVTSDVSAGITNKIRSSSYQTSVSTRLGFSADENNSNKDILKLVETLSWKQNSSKKDDESNISTDENNTFFGRSCFLGNDMDIDSVDGSYSLHSSIASKTALDGDIQKNDNDDDDEEEEDLTTSSFSCVLPKAITGIKSDIVSTVIEHCLVTSETERVRCFLLYSKNGLLGRSSGVDEDRLEQLVRVVICHENKMVEGNNDNLLLELNSSSGGNDLERLSSAIYNSNMGNIESELEIVKSPMTMMTLSLGPWLGDSVIRDRSYNDALPKSSSKQNFSVSSKGFGAPKKDSIQSKQHNSGFGEWVMGVQKTVMQFKWDYGSNVRHVLDFGKSMGSYCEGWPSSLSGTIYEERFSRRLKPEDRAMYIDYDMSAYCGFLCGSVYVKAPRLLSFSKAKVGKPIHTEVVVFQKTSGDIQNSVEENEKLCSRITRLYDEDGQLKQGSTSFFTLKQMTEASMDELSP